MIPGNSLSSILEYGLYLYPDTIPIDSTYSYQLGGIELNNTSQGLQYQAWLIQIGGTPTLNTVIISSANHPPSILFSLPAITEVSLAFDQNMNPFVSYVSQGNAAFWWYDATLPGYTFTLLPNTSSNPRCTLDDKRPTDLSLGSTDILLAYLLNNNLYYVQQRDRYTIARVLYVGVSSLIPAPFLHRIGMNQKYRIQFELGGTLFQ